MRFSGWTGFSGGQSTSSEYCRRDTHGGKCRGIAGDSLCPLICSGSSAVWADLGSLGAKENDHGRDAPVYGGNGIDGGRREFFLAIGLPGSGRTRRSDDYAEHFRFSRRHLLLPAKRQGYWYHHGGADWFDRAGSATGNAPCLREYLALDLLDCRPFGLVGVAAHRFALASDSAQASVAGWTPQGLSGTIPGGL